jgi:hypothetical protein
VADYEWLFILNVMSCIRLYFYDGAKSHSRHNRMLELFNKSSRYCSSILCRRRDFFIGRFSRRTVNARPITPLVWRWPSSARRAKTEVIDCGLEILSRQCNRRRIFGRSWRILSATERENKRLHDEWLDVAITRCLIPTTSW